jgi:sec-independent protein translocase protein TatC
MSKGPQEMSFFEHLDALRGHLFRAVLAVVACAGAWLYFKDFLFGQIIFGPMNADFPTYRLMCWLSRTTSDSDALCIHPPFKDTFFQAIGVGETFMIHLKASIFMGILVAFPYILWEFWRFVRPGLHEKEQYSTRGVVFACTLLFMLGTAFGYFVAMPLAANFLINYTLPLTENKPTVDSFVNFVLMMTLPIGLIFELPVVVYFLSKLGLITHRFMRQYRRHAIVVLMIAAGVITPSPDLFSQLLVFVPLYGLYELSILVAKRETLKIEKALDD